MAALKSETVTFRIRPEIKDSLRSAAARERRSLANMLEVMIEFYAGRQAAPPVPGESPGRELRIADAILPDS
ncbi:hypothetical protein [Thiococcus pfennigii]|uniref:hypothetical protein n=1 Tax=Thiococcus pfennigii TaxID=1057 RepID=UPI00190552AC|nr:hypothetical protein [Thiococcus pfennigii]MBK1732761.1 hypothetical protein [Thiococcus pfennigii]